MQPGITIREFTSRIENNHRSRKDYLVSTDQMIMRPLIDDDEENKLALEFKGPDGPQSFVISPLAHRQICTHVDIGAKYYDRLLAEAPRLLSLNVNQWFHLTPDLQMIRTAGSIVRAFLSSRYHRIDNHHVAEIIFPVLVSQHLRPISMDIGNQLYIQAINPHLSEKVGDDLVYAGFCIKNSELGGTCTVSPLLYNANRANVIITQDWKYRPSQSSKITTTEALWEQDSKKAAEFQTLLRIREAALDAIEPEKFRQRVERLRYLSRLRVSNKLRCIARIAQRYEFNDNEKHILTDFLGKAQHHTALTLVNAIVSMPGKTYDRSIHLQEVGGLILNSTDWDYLLGA